MEMECLFCEMSEGITDQDSKTEYLIRNEYQCPRCGPVYLDAATMQLSEFTPKQKKIISIYLRNNYESRGRIPSGKKLTTEDLRHITEIYHEKDAIEKMDTALENMDNLSKHVGAILSVTPLIDFPYFHCFQPVGLASLISLLEEADFINITSQSDDDLQVGLKLTSEGYKRLREIKRAGKDSRQCFVAMWFTDEMKEVYKTSIKPAIEYNEEGQKEPRFKALTIAEKKHDNDINNEIIAEIRRSRFMVCDLTGYRGGVYWEAGFAYGLGLEVIYTCRKDWVEEIKKEIFDGNGKKHEIIQEGIHFDLEHRYHIEWTEDDLPKFEKDLNDHIRAIIA